ncbi:MAG: YjjG family noncanonical pyrimidine nucleotidase [Bacteroidales bacterium]|nr:YjjG family noncanonical pyrimidine nucleotidase [Bacteroidales bacterium]MDD4656033.1 YjjG family noncanonical pyrimidine nucleotidase [Bacteroidales bacterium]
MLKKEYKYFLFDLDRTLWDFDKNAENNINTLLDRYKLSHLNKVEFYKKYYHINKKLWSSYEKGEISKERLSWERFKITLLEFGIDNHNLAQIFGREYLEQMPHQTALMPHAKEVLKKLKEKGCKMAIITNGFKEVQYKKLSNAGINHYFDAILISEEEGIHKPSPIIFKRALNAINGVKNKAIMVGDNFTNDIEGAMIFGIDQFFYNYKRAECNGGPTYNSADLRDLITLAPQQ